MDILERMREVSVLSRPRVRGDSEVRDDPDPKSEGELLATITGYIPTEIIVAWITVKGIIEGASKPFDAELALWVMFVVIALLAPFYLYTFTDRKDDKIPWYQITVGSIAFPIWVFCLGEPYSLLSWYNPAIGSLILVVFGVILVPIGHKQFNK